MIDFGLIDAQYILRRNYHAILGSSESGMIVRNQLLQSFFQSIFKLKRDFNFSKAILLWDKYPYKKLQIIESYKSDRSYASEDSVDEAKEAFDSASEEEKEELLRQLQEEEIKAKNEKQFQSAKYTIIKELGPSGLFSMIKSGFEADDLAYLTAQYILKNNQTGILLSKDSDWIYFRNKNVNFFTPKGDSFDKSTLDGLRLCKFINDKSKIKLSLYECGILNEIYGGSHNNIESYPHNHVTFDEFCYKIINNDESLPDYNRVKTYFDAMNMVNYKDEVKAMIYTVLYKTNLDPSVWYEFCSANFIPPERPKYELFIHNTKFINN